MEQTTKQNLIDAISVMMKPLVRLLINNGVTHADFSDILKDVYVDASIRHFSDDQRVNRSQIAFMTGLTRKEVKKVIDRAVEEGESHRLHSRPERVLSGWHNDPDFTGPYGVPLELPYETPDGSRSFSQLVKTYSGDMSARVTLEELKRGGSVIEQNGMIKAVKRYFEPRALSGELISRLGEIGHKFFSTAAANIEKSEQGSGYFDRRVYSENGCTPEIIARFDEYIKIVGQEFLEDLDRWFAANDRRSGPDEERKDTGLYMVHYVESPSEKTSLSQLLAERGVAAD